MFKTSVKYQYYATFCVNILSLAYGAFCMWPSISIIILQSNESPLESGAITNEELSWIGSLLCLGGLTGNFIFGWLSDKFGRKISILLIVIPLLIAWILIIIAKNVFYLYISRFLGGAAGGGIFSTLPVYVTEISEDRIRGSLGSYLVLSTNVGALMAFILGKYLSYYTIPYVLLIFPALFLMGFVFLPETPQHLLKMRKEKEAEHALRYFRNLRKISQEPPEKFKNELQKLKNDYLDDDKLGDEVIPLSLKDFSTKPAKKSLLIGAMLMGLNQFCGLFGMMNYTSKIFEESGSSIDSSTASMIIGIIQIFGSQASTILVEKSGRKLLISLSAISTSFGLSCLGTYSLLSYLNYDTSSIRWVPIASFSFTIFVGNLGILTLPFLVVSELLPPRIRNIGATLSMTMLWIFSFTVLKELPILMGIIGMHGCMYIFALFSFLGGILTILFVPETKGKSSDEILMMLE